MLENLKFYKGLEANLPTYNIEPGALYHCEDTGNTYIGITTTEMKLYSSAVGKYSSDGSISFDGGNAWFEGRIKVGGTGWDDAEACEVALRNEITTWQASDDGNGNITLFAAAKPIAEEMRF